ncbi:MAG TPA: dipeptide epimerase [Vicinamibacterales bacterium]|nr:dipeptide epimerase [Vicinamibacterales bacterium]
MKHGRRQFITISTLAGGALALPSGGSAQAPPPPRARSPRARMSLKWRPFTAELRHVFTLATSSRSTTPEMLTEISYDGVTGYGEASMPPYLGETQESCAAFLAKVDLSGYPNPFELETILADIDAIAPGNAAAKASVDLALHDLIGKLMGQPWYNIWGFNPEKTPHTTFTIGIDTPEVVRQKVREAKEFKVLKVKLGRENDHEMIDTIRSVTSVPLTADVNQGWKDRQRALDELHWLKDRNVVVIEQPFPKEAPLEDLAWLTERSPIPILADESCQRLSDIRPLYGAVSGVNIKLMKSTGMREAHRMLTLARSLGMKVMLGCMTETSCAISAASHLSPMVDWADLDGALLIANDPFKGTTVVDGKVTLGPGPGLGVTRLA